MKYSQYPKNDSNPFFTKNINKNVKTKTLYQPDNRTAIVDYNTGEIKEQKVTSIFRYTKVDEEQFVKIYTNTISLWFDLSKTAQKILGYIIKNLKPNEDRFFIEFDIAAEKLGYAKFDMIYKGLTELMEKKIIARSRLSYSYYINPSFLFNGNRVILGEAIEKINGSGDKLLVDQKAIDDPYEF